MQIPLPQVSIHYSKSFFNQEWYRPDPTPDLHEPAVRLKGYQGTFFLLISQPLLQEVINTDSFSVLFPHFFWSLSAQYCQYPKMRQSLLQSASKGISIMNENHTSNSPNNCVHCWWYFLSNFRKISCHLWLTLCARLKAWLSCRHCSRTYIRINTEIAGWII